MTKDPVCGMIVEETTPFQYERDGKMFYFCSERCRQKFLAAQVETKPNSNPESYLGATADGGKKEQTEVSAKAQWTCPMHPEIIRYEPGSCPKCGMSLEPRNPLPAEGEIKYTCPMHPEIIRNQPGHCPKCGMALEPKTASITGTESNPEYDDMYKRFIVGAILTLPLLIIAMRDMIPGGGLLDTLAAARTYEWLELLLATPVVLWAGWPFFVRGVQSVINRSLNMFTLIGLGVSVAYLYSLIGVLFPYLFPATMRTAKGTVGIYFEAASVIVVLILLGQVLELRARSRTGTAIKKLLGLAPKTARKIDTEGNESDIPLEHVMKGDRLRVRPGKDSRGRRCSGKSKQRWLNR